MATYFVRHGRTSYSARYLVNGDSNVPIALDEQGVRQAQAISPRLQEMALRSCWTSSFPRTRQTARLLLEGIDCPQSVHPCLNEPDYGVFEGRPFLEYADWLKGHGPTTQPPGSQESQREALLRMLSGCVPPPTAEAPRLVVAHGLLLSVLNWCRSREPETSIPVFFPEAPYLELLAVSDRCLRDWASRLSDELQGELDSNAAGGDPGISSKDDRTVLRPPEPVPASLEENESDA
ncbi:histidine phosphatase family protein [Nocardiopsis sp. CC223A]|uniref:histidine phosphatase family protein n=1 Tax=Nocardiopsis sp. CC223A TaxID=3044051 RepID=UPI00278C44D4|nr:histidine phosphatase family protein [Nocardiopsis sp. CC223A]